MAVTLTSDFKLDERLLQSMFVNRVFDKTDVLNANSNDAFTLTNEFISGYAPKEAHLDSIEENIVSRMRIDQQGDVPSQKLVQSQTGGVKVWRRIGPVELTQTSITEGRYTTEMIYRYIAEMAARGMMRNHRQIILSLLPKLILKNPAKYEQTKKTFKPTDTLKGLTFFGEFDNFWRMCLMSIQTYVGGLTQQYDDKIGNFSGLATQDGMLYALGRPIRSLNDTLLNVADADADTAQAQAGKWPYFLPFESFRLTITEQPMLVTDIVTGKDQLAIRYQAQYPIVIFPKMHEWTGTAKNPDDAALFNDASWVDRAKSHNGSIGFGLQHLDS